MSDTFSTLPGTAHEAMDWSWGQFEPYFRDLDARTISTGNINQWLADWTRLWELLDEAETRLSVASTQDTTDKAAEQRYLTFLANVVEPAEAGHQKLKEKFLASGIEPAGFEIPLRNMRAEAQLFHEANLPLLTEEQKFNNEYSRIMSTQTIEWDGKELTIPQLAPIYENPDRSVREQVWRLGAARQLADRAAINDLWTRYMKLRG